MAASRDGGGGGEPPVDLRAFPVPLSPPYPPLSKDMELRRAMSAASRSALFALSDADVVFEDPWLVVVNKPPGVYCEALLSASAADAPPSGDGRGKAVSFWSSRAKPRSRFCSGAGGGGGCATPELHLANRLDRDTSGLMMITKSHEAAARLVKAFTDHRVRKTYIALCTGKSPSWQRIRVVSGHGRSRFGAWRVYAASDVGRALPGGSTVRHMATSFEVLAVNGRKGECGEPWDWAGEAETVVVEEQAAAATEEEEGGRADEMLVRARPESGRTHQIRLHSQYLGMPIRGDAKYGGVREREEAACGCHALHAESLELQHPITDAPLRLRAPIPPWAREALGGAAV